MNRFALGMAIFAAFLLSCGSAEVRNEEAPKKLQVVHSVTYGHKGTKSESRSGSLSVNGEVLPDVFTAVEADGELYAFRTRTQVWGIDGYFPAEDGAAFPAGKASPGKDELSRGWYEPAWSGGLPSGWILVKWTGGSAAVNPAKIKDFIAAKSLKPVPRTGMPGKILK